MNNYEWFRQAKFGMMIHFGLYSLLGGEYNGQRNKGFSEWTQLDFKIPNREYEKLAKAFNPIFFDAEQLAITAKNTGMQYIVITAKHHDGFCLFNSAYDDYNCKKGSPFNRDIIEELSITCKKHGIKLGLYYSQELDWHEPNGGGFVEHGCSSNTWDFPDNSKKDFSQYFNGKVKTQIKELLTNYGDICLLWCDMPRIITHEQSEELFHFIKSLQKDCLVNSRIGNGLGDYRSTGDNVVDFNIQKENEECEIENASSYEYLVGKKFNLYECPATLNDTWGYKPFDNNWKSFEKLQKIKTSLNERGINYLLNVGLDALGRIPAPSLEIIKKFNK